MGPACAAAPTSAASHNSTRAPPPPRAASAAGLGRAGPAAPVRLLLQRRADGPAVRPPGGPAGRHAGRGDPGGAAAGGPGAGCWGSLAVAASCAATCAATRSARSPYFLPTSPAVLLIHHRSSHPHTQVFKVAVELKQRRLVTECLVLLLPQFGRCTADSTGARRAPGQACKRGALRCKPAAPSAAAARPPMPPPPPCLHAVAAVIDLMDATLSKAVLTQVGRQPPLLLRAHHCRPQTAAGRAACCAAATSAARPSPPERGPPPAPRAPPNAAGHAGRGAIVGLLRLAAPHHQQQRGLGRLGRQHHHQPALRGPLRPRALHALRGLRCRGARVPEDPLRGGAGREGLGPVSAPALAPPPRAAPHRSDAAAAAAAEGDTARHRCTPQPPSRLPVLNPLANLSQPSLPPNCQALKFSRVSTPSPRPPRAAPRPAGFPCRRPLAL